MQLFALCTAMVHKVVPPCATVMVPGGCVGAEDVGELNAAVNTTGTFTVMLVLGDCGAAVSVYAGAALLMVGIFREFVEVTKLVSPEYVAITAAAGAVKVV